MRVVLYCYPHVPPACADVAGDELVGFLRLGTIDCQRPIRHGPALHDENQGPPLDAWRWSVDVDGVGGKSGGVPNG